MSRGLRPGVLVLLSLLWLAPLYLFVANAIRPGTGFDPAKAWDPPSSFGLWHNLTSAWDQGGFGSSVLSTLLYSSLSPALAIVIGALAGYAIVVLRVRHGFGWFTFIFGATVFPAQMLLIPLFVNYANHGLYDTRTGLVLIYTAISVPFAAFVMRNFFTGIAYSIFEAARVDGASLSQIFWRIYIPMSRTALAAVFVLQFTFIWNDLLFGVALSASDGVRPIMPALAALQTAYSTAPTPVVLAAGLFTSLPTMVLFLAAQRLFVRGLALGQS